MAKKYVVMFGQRYSTGAPVKKGHYSSTAGGLSLTKLRERAFVFTDDVLFAASARAWAEGHIAQWEKKLGRRGKVVEVF